MGKNDDILREEFSDKVTRAYRGAELDAETKARYKQKILTGQTGKAREKIIFKVAPVLALCLVFVVLNVVMFGMNSRRNGVNDETIAGGSSEEATMQTNSQATTESVSESATDEREIYVIYETNLSVGLYVNEEIGFVKSDDNFWLQVVVNEVVHGNTPEIDEKINNKEQITGKFALRVIDRNGIIRGEINLSSGATSEYGITLPFDEKELAKKFVVYDNMVAFRHFTGEENGTSKYLTAFYGINAAGEIFNYQLERGIDPTSSINYMSISDVVTTDLFFQVEGTQSIYSDNVPGESGTENAYYYFNEKMGCMTIESVVISSEKNNADEIKNNQIADEKLKAILASYMALEDKNNINNSIETAQKYYEVFINGEISGGARDFTSNGLGTVLNKMALADKEKYASLFDPVSAAEGLLNLDLTNDDVELFENTSEDSIGITVWIAFENSGRSAQVYMVKPFGGEGIWVPQSSVIPKDWGVYEDIINIAEADINHDGTDDYIVTFMTNSDATIPPDADVADKVNTERAAMAEKLLKGSYENCFVRIFDGRKTKSFDDRFYEENCIWWVAYSNTHVANGFSVLTSMNGEDYMMTGDISEQQGDCVYGFSVWYLDENGEQEVDGNIVYFINPELISQEMQDRMEKKLVRKDVVPSFRKNISKWFEGATLLAAFDVWDTNSACVSTDEKQRKPEEYFDNIWSRE